MKIITGLLADLYFRCMPAVKTSAFLLLIFSINTALPAQNEKGAKEEFPVPSGNQKQLFYLQRTENTNTVIYEWNEENGNLNMANPIRAFWILYAKNGQREDLSGMEKKLAYGIKIKSVTKEQCQFTLAAYPKIILTLLKDADQTYHVHIRPSAQNMILKRIYIKEKAGFLKMEPSVDYVEFSGTDAITGKEVTERIDP